MKVFIENEAKNQRLLKRNAAAIESAQADSLAMGGDILITNHLKVWSGRTSCYRVVNFMTDSPRNWIGRFVTARITKATSFSLEGEVVAEEGASGLSVSFMEPTTSEVIA